MADVLWTINPKYDSLAMTISKIVEFAQNVFENSNKTLNLKIEQIQEKNTLSIENRRLIFTIFKNAIKHFEKYSASTSISLAVKKEGVLNTITLSEEGLASHENLSTTDFWALELEDKAKHLKADFSIISSPEGTKVEMIIS